MKKTIYRYSSLLLSFVLILCLTSCGNTVDKEGVWENAIYLKDTKLGSGGKTFTLEVSAEGQLVSFTVSTDKDTVGAALLESELISGEDSEFGLYIKRVNGITADYETDRSYWAFYIDGEYAMSGVDSTEITEGATYRLERTK